LADKLERINLTNEERNENFQWDPSSHFCDKE
jgi:hypothetical protein